MPDHPALAGGVHPLQHHQDLLGPVLAGPAVGEQPLLQFAELGGQGLGQRRGIGLAFARKARGGRPDRKRRGRPGRPAVGGVRSATDLAAAGDFRPRLDVFLAMGLILPDLPGWRHAVDLRCGRHAARDLDDAALVELYRFPVPPDRAFLRSNFVMSLDGSVQGPDGRSGSINTESDHHVFALQRALADAVIVGAGTARAEGYRADRPRPLAARSARAERARPLPDPGDHLPIRQRRPRHRPRRSTAMTTGGPVIDHRRSRSRPAARSARRHRPGPAALRRRPEPASRPDRRRTAGRAAADPGPGRRRRQGSARPPATGSTRSPTTPCASPCTPTTARCSPATAGRLSNPAPVKLKPAGIGLIPPTGAGFVQSGEVRRSMIRLPCSSQCPAPGSAGPADGSPGIFG